MPVLYREGLQQREPQVGAATCNSDSIFFSSLTAQYHFILTHNSLYKYYFSPSLDQGLGTLVFPMASVFLSVQDSYTVLYNASAQLTTSSWLLGHPRREVLIAPSLVCIMGHELHLPSQRGRRMVFLLMLT